jgi:hypothetical protein
LSESDFSQFGIESRFEQRGNNREQDLTFLDQLAFPNRHRFQISAFQRTNFNVSLGMDLADILLHRFDIADNGIRGHYFVLSVVRLAVIFFASWQRKQENA